MHEILHDTVGGHGENFTSHLNKLYAALGFKDAVKFQQELFTAFQQHASGLGKWMQKFNLDIRHRDAKGIDIFEVD